MPKTPINYKIKSYFDKLKREKKVTSKDIATVLQVSPQTVTAMSGRLDQISVSQVFKMAAVLKVDAHDFASTIYDLSEGYEEK